MKHRELELLPNPICYLLDEKKKEKIESMNEKLRVLFTVEWDIRTR